MDKYSSSYIPGQFSNCETRLNLNRQEIVGGTLQPLISTRTGNSAVEDRPHSRADDDLRGSEISKPSVAIRRLAKKAKPINR